MVLPKPELTKSEYQSLLMGSGLQDRDDALAAGRADRDQAAHGAGSPLGRLLVQQLRQGGDDAGAGGGERVAGGQRGSDDVELRPVERAQRLVAAELLLAEDRVLPRGERGEDR